MPIFSVHQAKTHLSRLIRLAEDGHQVIITRMGIPVARVVAPGSLPSARRPGSMNGLITLSDDIGMPGGPTDAPIHHPRAADSQSSS
jgi:prevent-host-death family protein